MLLDNETGGDVFPLPIEGRQSSRSRQRAVLVGQIWSADLADTLMHIYSPLLAEGYTLEDISRLVQELGDDRSGD